MYRINALQKKVLITADEVVFHAPVKEQIDIRMIEQSIIIAEERFVRPTIGFEMYLDMIDQKNQIVTSSNKESLQTAVNASLPEGALPVILKDGDVLNASEFLNTEYKALWNEYLWKLAAEAIMIISLPEGFVQFGSVGTHLSAPPAGPMNDSKNVTPDLKSLQYVMDKKLQDRIDPLTQAMHLWICYQRKLDKNKYSKYAQKCPCDELPDGLSTNRKTQFLTSVYDD